MAVAGPVLTEFEENMMSYLDSEPGAIHTLQRPREIAKGIFLPYAVTFSITDPKWYTPGCYLVDRKDYTKTLMLLGSFNTGFPACGGIRGPVITYLNGGYFATYEYLLEDPKNVFRSFFEVVKLVNSGFYRCKEDLSFSLGISRLIQTSLDVAGATQLIVKKYGCTINKNTFWKEPMDARPSPPDYLNGFKDGATDGEERTSSCGCNAAVNNRDVDDETAPVSSK